MARKTTAKKAVRKPAKKPRGPKGKYTKRPPDWRKVPPPPEPVRVLRRIHGRLVSRWV